MDEIGGQAAKTNIPGQMYEETGTFSPGGKLTAGMRLFILGPKQPRTTKGVKAMTRDWHLETQKRVSFLRQALADAGATGFVLGNSGGKDSALAAILCKQAAEDTVGVLMPVSGRNFAEDTRDALALAQQYDIQTRTVSLKAANDLLTQTIGEAAPLTDMARANIAPRLRMLTLYAIAASEGRLVIGTGNRSERYMGYFTKWGDGACDVNPIADLTVAEVYAFLRHLGAPSAILTKAPSAALFDGQTDEAEMGVTYEAIDRYLQTGEASEHDRAIIERMHRSSHHKRHLPLVYRDDALL